MKTSNRHRFISATFCVVFVINVLLPSIIYVNFKVNQEFIAANLCVEKEIEESTCNGNCQLKKSLAVVEATKPQKENFQATIESHITGLFLTVASDFSISKKIENLEYSFIPNHKITTGYFLVPFRPPILS